MASDSYVTGIWLHDIGQEHCRFWSFAIAAASSAHDTLDQSYRTSLEAVEKLKTILARFANGSFRQPTYD